MRVFMLYNRAVESRLMELFNDPLVSSFCHHRSFREMR
jgi:hypothetical protein